MKLLFLLLILISLKFTQCQRTISLSATIYDHTPSRQVDMEVKGTGPPGSVQEGVVLSTLDSSTKLPTYCCGLNIPIPYDLVLTETGVNTGIYEYGTTFFFPIDGRGFDNKTEYPSEQVYYDVNGYPRNFHFCMTIHSEFAFNGGEVFSFAGDDDVWIFFNGQLLVDLVSIHPIAQKTVYLDGIPGLIPGNSYDFDMYYCERHTDNSDLIISANLKFFCPYYDACGVCRGNNDTCCKEVCEGSNQCFFGTCSIDTGFECVQEARNCDDNNTCTDDSCDETQGCINIALDCNDDDHCTLDGCDANSGCYHIEIEDCRPCDPSECITLDPCFPLECNPNTFGDNCVTREINCTVYDPCAISRCENGYCIVEWICTTTPTPTENPTETPTENPTLSPTLSPTVTPTVTPTVFPTVFPTILPTDTPTVTPMVSPTVTPTVSPTDTPTVSPTPTPTVSPKPTLPPRPPPKGLQINCLNCDDLNCDNNCTIISKDSLDISDARNYYGTQLYPNQPIPTIVSTQSEVDSLVNQNSGNNDDERLVILLKQHQQQEQEKDKTFDTNKYFNELSTDIFGKNLIHCGIISSTQDIMIADQQTKGRGRCGYKFLSLMGSLLMSFKCKQTDCNKLPFLQYLTGMAMVEAIQSFPIASDLNIRLKWPNEIFSNEATNKIGSVLCESKYFNNEFDVVIGIGTYLSNSNNPSTTVNQLIHQKQHGSSFSTTSADIPIYISREELVSKFFNKFEPMFMEFTRDGFNEDLKKRYTDYWMHTNQIVKLKEKENHHVKIIGISDSGFLKVIECDTDGNTSSNSQLVELNPETIKFDNQNSVLMEISQQSINN
ncbi:hypothetical protein ACTFIY_001989 [Dictyostelium cf. discoideum]